MSSSMDAGLQPDTAEVLQQETPSHAEPAVPVRIDGPVRTQRLPRKAGAARTKTVAAGASVQLLPADHRRARATLIGTGGNFYVAFTAAAASDISVMALWPQTVPLQLEAVTEVWVQAATGSVQITYLTEMWAAGE